jgi:choline dehydrogenase
MTQRVVVVGAGMAGCVVASRLSATCDVTLVEAGRGGNDASASPTWSMPAQLTATRTWTATPGRAVGGSSVVGGGYFAPPEREDLDAWHSSGGSAWHPDRVLAHIAEFGELLGVHGTDQEHPLARAFRDAAHDLGIADGLLALDSTTRDGEPRNVADLLPPSVEVRSNSRATRVLVREGRATGVEVAEADGTVAVHDADEVVLCAGGFGTARLLLASGIGPAADLRTVGIDVIADLPVGTAFSDHPTVWVEFAPTDALAREPWRGDGAFPIALRLGLDGGAGDVIELLACTRPPDLGASADDRDVTYGVVVGLQRPEARGAVGVASARPLASPRIDYGYLSNANDRRALRAGVRAAARMLESAPYRPLVGALVDLDTDVLDDDAELNGWIAARLGSAAHTCGTAPMGTVVDGAGRVHGVANLSVADASLLPVVPSRAPGAAALAVGAIIAEQLLS